MKNFKHMTRLLLCCLLCLGTVGCVSTKYVEPKHYLFNIKTLPEKKVASDKSLVLVEHVTAIAPFNQLEFLYRIKSSQYLTDYYHSFLVSPAEQIDLMLTNYLKALSDFNLDNTNTVLTTVSTVSNKLQVQIVELYADYRDNTHPQAIVSLRFILTRVVDNKPIVLFDKVLYGKVALKEKNTTSLLSAWNMGLQDVLKRGVGALNRALNL